MGTAKGSLFARRSWSPPHRHSLEHFPLLGALGKRRKGQRICFRPSGGAAGWNSVYLGSLGVEMGKTSRVEGIDEA